MRLWPGKTTTMKRWTFELADGTKGFTFGRRPQTREWAIEHLAHAYPGIELVSCEAYVPPPVQSVWLGRNAYRDANPKWWECLYGR